jgi:hypothetical protein
LHGSSGWVADLRLVRSKYAGGAGPACEPRFADAISDRATLRLPSWRERPKPMSFRLRRAPYKPIEQVVSQTRLIDIADRIVCKGAVGVSGSVEGSQRMASHA